MALLQLSVKLASGVTHSEKRGVAFLRGKPELSEPDELNAGREFDAMSNKAGRRMRHRMGLWVSVHPDIKGKFHGFKEYGTKYRECYTFIDLDEKIRFYGFRCHPKQGDPRYEIVLLTSCVSKKEDAVNMRDLDRVLMWKDNMATNQALTKFEEDNPEVKK